jgi:hypothetical protein
MHGLFGRKAKRARAIFGSASWQAKRMGHFSPIALNVFDDSSIIQRAALFDCNVSKFVPIFKTRSIMLAKGPLSGDHRMCRP